MIIVDETKPPAEMTDEEYSKGLVELLRLVDGLPSATYVCACRRPLRVGIAHELRELLERLRPEVYRRTGRELAEHLPETSRFGLIEVD